MRSVDATRLASGVAGRVAPGFESIVEPFLASHNPRHGGSSLSIWHDGTEVVNLWSGIADERDGRPWEEHTLSALFSATKGLVSLLIAGLAASGELDPEKPVRDLWPEFAEHGKGEITVADVLAHRAGVSAPVDDLTLADVLDRAGWATRIAAQEPLWTPGTAHAYHAQTFGILAEEIVLRATGRDLRELFAERIADPLGAEIALRLPREDLARVAHLTTTPIWDEALAPGPSKDEVWISRALSLGGAFPPGLVEGESGFNDERVQLAGFLGAGGIGTASGLARVWSAAITPTLGIRLLDDAGIDALRRPRSEGPWAFDPGPPYHRWGAGVQLSSDITPWLSDESFGHDGAGGQLGLADTRYGVAIGYLRNRMDVIDPTPPIIAALRSILDG